MTNNSESIHQWQGLSIVLPAKSQARVDDSIMFGHAAWLWMQSTLHRDWPISLLQTNVVPALKNRQYVIVGNGTHPVLFAAWALMSDEAQERYLQNPNSLENTDWQSGENMWWVDWVAPFGHTQQVAAYLKKHVFSDRTGRSLRVKSGSKVARIIDFHGDKVTPLDRDISNKNFANKFNAMNLQAAFKKTNVQETKNKADVSAPHTSQPHTPLSH